MCCFVPRSSSADCIANYGNHPENKQAGQLGSETAIYSDVNLSNKLNEIKTFTNTNLCYVSPDGDSSATYEPIPYATTQLIQANIKNKAAACAAIAEPLDMPCWKQPPNLPPIPKEMAAQMQYNIIEQNMLNKGISEFNMLAWSQQEHSQPQSTSASHECEAVVSGGIVLKALLVLPQFLIPLILALILL